MSTVSRVINYMHTQLMHLPFPEVKEAEPGYPLRHAIVSIVSVGLRARQRRRLRRRWGRRTCHCRCHRWCAFLMLTEC